jgi:hypothetical protein
MRRRPPRLPHRPANGPAVASADLPLRASGEFSVSALGYSEPLTQNSPWTLILRRKTAATGCQPRSLLDITSLIETRWFRGYCDMLNIVSSKARGEASMSAKNGSIKLVAGNSNPALAQEIADWLHVPLTKAVVRRFADMEIFVEIQENVRGSDVFVIQSTSFPANDHLMELLIITDALRRPRRAASPP